MATKFVLDDTSPYYVYPSEGSGVSITTVIFNGEITIFGRKWSPQLSYPKTSLDSSMEHSHSKLTQKKMRKRPRIR